MASDKPTESGDTFGTLLTQWERNFNEMANQVMGTEGFSQAMNEMQKAQLTAQRVMTDGLSRQMEAMNIPTRNDVLRLAEAVKALDRRMERIEDKLGVAEPASPVTQAPRPARTKQPPTEYLQGKTS